MKILLFVGLLLIVLVMLSMNVIEGATDYTIDQDITWLRGIAEIDNNRTKKMEEIQKSRSSEGKHRIKTIIGKYDKNPADTIITYDTKLGIAINRLEKIRDN